MSEWKRKESGSGQWSDYGKAKKAAKMAALQSLYGKNQRSPEPATVEVVKLESLKTQEKAVKKDYVKPVIPTEDQEQARLVTYLHRKNILVFAIANGGSRNMLEAVKLKRTGVSPGVPDLMIPMPRKGFHGLFIEMKRSKGGKVSDVQRYWLEALTANGYRAVVCAGADEAIEVVENYFN